MLELELLLGLDESSEPVALPEIVESCDAVPADVPPWSEPDVDVAELPCELSVTEPETLELEDDELGVVEFKLSLAELDPLGAPAPEVLIDVLL